MQRDPADEWQEWFRLAPLDRWRESMKRCDGEGFLKSPDGSKVLKGLAIDYELPVTGHPTCQPEVPPLPDGGLFVSICIDPCAAARPSMIIRAWRSAFPP
jgi:hypothetical protein